MEEGDIKPYSVRHGRRTYKAHMCGSFSAPGKGIRIVEARRAVVTSKSNTKNKENIYSVNAGVFKCRITSPNVSLRVIVSPILAHRVHVRVSTCASAV